MKTIHKSAKLANVCYDIRGPVLDKARQMEEEGHKIIKLNIGNLAVPKSFFVFGTLMPGSDYDFKKDEPPSGYASDHCPIALDLKVVANNAAKPKTDAPAPAAAKEVAK